MSGAQALVFFFRSWTNVINVTAAAVDELGEVKAWIESLRRQKREVSLGNEQVDPPPSLRKPESNETRLRLSLTSTLSLKRRTREVILDGTCLHPNIRYLHLSICKTASSCCRFASHPPKMSGRQQRVLVQPIVR